MDVFYIENEVGEMEKAISGYFSSFDKAYEVLQDTYAYQGQYIGPGKIYQVEVDALRPHPALVCVYGATVNKDSELYKLTESVFKVLSDSPIVLDEKHLYDGFFQFASNCNHPACWKLNDYFIENNVTPTSPAFQMCFDSLYLQQKEATKEEHAIKFNLNAAVIFGDGFKGKVVAYDPQADMYLIEHESYKGQKVIGNGWYPPEQLNAAPEERQVSSVDSLISRATAISEQSRGLANDLGKLKDGFEIDV